MATEAPVNLVLPKTYHRHFAPAVNKVVATLREAERVGNDHYHGAVELAKITAMSDIVVELVRDQADERFGTDVHYRETAAALRAQDRIMEWRGAVEREVARRIAQLA